MTGPSEVGRNVLRSGPHHASKKKMSFWIHLLLQSRDRKGECYLVIKGLKLYRMVWYRFISGCWQFDNLYSLICLISFVK